MAVHPPTGPFPPNDGSNIFRRGMPRPKSIPPADDTSSPPPEPAEPLDLDDEDAIFGGPPTAQPGHDDDPALSGVMLSEPADDEPASGLLLEVDEVPPDDSIEDALADQRPPASAADSSIFTGGPLPPTGVGSGWLDASASAARKAEPASGDLWGGGLPADLPPPVKPPSTLKFEDAAELFADLRDDSPASDSLWVEAAVDANGENTGRLSESEVLRAFDTSRDPNDSSLAEFDLGGAESELIGGKGDAIEFDDTLSDHELDPGGSSIFDRNLPATEIVTDADNVDFDIPVPGDGSHQSSMGGAASGGVMGDPDAVAADLFGRGGDEDEPVEVEAVPVDATDDRAPAIAAAVAAGALGGVGAAPSAREPRPTAKARSSAVAPPPTRRAKTDEDEDDDKPEPKKRGGIGGLLAGLATGLAVGVGGFGIVYLAGLIPNEKKGPAVAAVAPAGDPQAAAKVEQLTTDLAEAKDKAAAELKEMRGSVTQRQKLLDEADAKLRTAEDDVTTAKKEATDAKKAATDAKKELADVTASVEPLKKAAEASKKTAEKMALEMDAAKTQAEKALGESEDAKKTVETFKLLVDTEKKNVTKKEKELEDARTALDDAKKDAADKAKLAADAEKKLKAADEAVGGVVKELKAAKLLDEKDDAAKLPDAIKKLAAVASSGDAKKAAEALVAAQKERDEAKAAAVKADADAKAAQALAVKAKTDADKMAADSVAVVEKAKTDADKKVAEAMKAADDKAKLAAEEATKDLKKQLADATTAAKKAQDDLTAAKATAKADAEAAMKVKVDDATAKAAAAQAALDAKVKALETEYAAKLAEARAGVVKVVPAEMEASEKAARSYADGVDAYRRRLFVDAEKLFAAAVAGQPGDARYWYYLGLARTQTGNAAAADAFKKGAEMEGRNKPSAKVIDAALERLGFSDKERVNQYRR